MMFQLHSCSSGIHLKNILQFALFLKIFLQYEARLIFIPDILWCYHFYIFIVIYVRDIQQFTIYTKYMYIFW